MYSIFFNPRTGLWEVKDNSTGLVIGRASTPVAAVNFAVNNGMPIENKTDLLAQAASGEANAQQDTQQATVDPALDENFTNTGLQGEIAQTRSQATAQDINNYKQLNDWRVKLRLAPGSYYLYNSPTPGILYPLSMTQGVIFPYTPSIQVQYTANYDNADLIHANYKVPQYKSSSVDNITVTGNFTAQDTNEANYVLAVIHFFRSMTKMFYGQDSDPKAGTPPPLCYLTGLGEYQFNNHPMAITGFTYTLPDNVDYIRATINETGTNGENLFGPGQSNFIYKNLSNAQNARRDASKIGPGGSNPPPSWDADYGSMTDNSNSAPTYVPTQIQLAITCIPVLSRFNISNKFSLQKYGTGSLVKGGMW